MFPLHSVDIRPLLLQNVLEFSLDQPVLRCFSAPTTSIYISYPNGKQTLRTHIYGVRRVELDARVRAVVPKAILGTIIDVVVAFAV